MNPSRNFVKRLLACAIAVSFASTGPLQAAATDIADAPLAQPATSVKPNLLLILDDSGSMARQFTPDYVSSNANAGTVANCFDSRDINSPPTATPQDCYAGDPPAMTTDYNTQYYNPAIRYFPAVNYDGSSRGEMNCTATGGTLVGTVCTGGWTSVPTDNVSSPGENSARKGLHEGSLSSGNAFNTNWDTGGAGTLTTMNLATGFPDRVWCNSTGASATDSSVCKTNSAYTYPDSTFGYGRDASFNRKYKLGAPYYYRINPTQHCTDATLTNCTAATSPTGSFTVPARVRFCDSTAHTNCQAKRTSTFRFPKFLGTVTAVSSGSAGVRAKGTISIIAAQDSSAPIILQITATLPAGLGGGTVNLISSTIMGSSGTNTQTGRNNVAVQIVNAINALTGTHGFTAAQTTSATSSGPAIVTITAPAPVAPAGEVDHNGTMILVNAPAGTPTTPAKLSFNIGSTDDGNSANQITIGTGGSAVALLSSSITCTSGAGCSGGGAARNSWMGGAIRTAINAGTATHGYTASGTGNTVTITAPAGTGAERNGFPLTFAQTGLTNVTGVVLAGGSAPNDLEHTASNFSGGANAVAPASWARQNVGDFVRTDIVPGQTYPRLPARSDCTGATTCSYEEEMTNFANWFSYYRTRIQQTKTAIGRAFLTLSSDFRVGFKTINFSLTHYLAVDDFNTGAGQQKNNWYNKLYGATANGITPNRLALARAGRYYGNQNPDSMGASPIQLACQPNYAILTTDGYWNDTSNPTQLNGSTPIGDQDSSDSGYSTKAVGAWDGNKASNTLADVAMYYYKTDLRPDVADQVPTTQKDTAPHQHMTTFTVGMGLAGTLTYDPNYEAQTSGDIFDIKQGTKFWPAPAANAETTLDDLWHAAVNGRGKFFSAQDPVTLSNGIAETLNSVLSRMGAGAAAATSNLQPVAGDNFAFTAQYQTVDWTGDLKARTIDLSSGIVASRELWSAQTLLDGRSHTTRRIYTFDASDTSAVGITLPSGATRPQNANKLRSFCWTTGTSEAAYPTCDDGGMLTTAEMDAHFDPMGGPNGQLYQSVPWPTDGSNRHVSATKPALVDFLRGDNANETTGGTALTDLYRNRSHVLGDIVNAQPAYVKVAPFSYADPFYSDFKTATATRRGTVYAAANDGMLHAFETDPDNNPYFQTAGIATAEMSDDTFTGTLNTSAVSGEGSERWAYIPTIVFPTLKRLAELNYSTNHHFTVDGSPVVGDVCFG